MIRYAMMMYGAHLPRVEVESSDSSGQDILPLHVPARYPP